MHHVQMKSDYASWIPTTVLLFIRASLDCKSSVHPVYNSSIDRNFITTYYIDIRHESSVNQVYLNKFSLTAIFPNFRFPLLLNAPLPPNQLNSKNLKTSPSALPISLMAESTSAPSNKTTPTSCTPVQVQHVTKTSSDKLLLKFGDPDSPKSPVKKHLPLALRRKKSSRRVASGLSARELTGGSDEWKVKRRRSGGAAEWRAGLLLPVSTREKKANGNLVRKMGIGRIDDVVGIGLILAALERTWQKTVASASKVFVEKHRTDHVRLISDMV